MEAAKILVDDDVPSNIKVLKARLTSEGYEVLEAENGPDALAVVEEQNPDLVLLDVMMPGMDGFEVCRRIKKAQGSNFLPVVLVTAQTESESIVKGLSEGADEYITKPFDPPQLLARVNSMLRIRRMYQENTYLRQAIARCIHYNGPRKDARFVAVNCGALSENLLESELFGHKKGGFTGATENRVGLFGSADGGTIFLDEIGETSQAMQVKLLRVLQEGEITLVGETEARKIDTRVLAATNRDLESEVSSGSFREDLYYRLNVFPITVPPLRDRRGDVPLLADHLLERHSAGSDDKAAGFSAEAMDALSKYDWPGNVRELENEIERALVLSSGEGASPSTCCRRKSVATAAPQDRGATLNKDSGRFS